MKKNWDEMENWEKEIYRQQRAVYNRINAAYETLKICEWSTKSDEFVKGFNKAVEFLKVWVDSSMPADED